MKKIICLLLCVIFTLICAFNVNATSRTASWYCARKKDHTQPNLPSDLEFSKEYNLYWIDDRYSSYDDGEKVIYLTFDAGYENGNVERILDALRDEGVSATFFILDNMIIKNEELVKRMIDEGHTVANHTTKHKDMTRLNTKDDVAKELKELEKLYEKAYGVQMPKLYRPPEGRISEQSLKMAQELGYTAIMWSFAYADWDNGKQPSCEYAMNKILDNLHNGEVMLLHPTSETNAKIMKDLIKELKSRGFRFATAQELCKN